MRCEPSRGERGDMNRCSRVAARTKTPIRGQGVLQNGQHDKEGAIAPRQKYPVQNAKRATKRCRGRGW